MFFFVCLFQLLQKNGIEEEEEEKEDGTKKNLRYVHDGVEEILVQLTNQKMRLSNVVVENCSDPMPRQTQPKTAGTSHRQRFEKPTGRSAKEKINNQKKTMQQQ